MDIDHSTMSHNGTGVQASGGTMRLSNSNVVFNNIGISGSVTSFGNNRVAGNSSDGAPLVAAGGATSDLGQK